jgi:predicted nucleic acid-binding protein
MTTFDARKPCGFEGRKFFFDTNVWININGFDPRPEFHCYSDYYKSLLVAGNTVVISDLVISEFHNRCCKTQHEICLEGGTTTEKRFKAFRVRPEATDFMESVRDTCLNLCEDCELDQLEVHKLDVPDVITQCTSGVSDYNDIAIQKLCLDRGYVLVTHDRDFADCGIEVVTANKRFLREMGINP